MSCRACELIEEMKSYESFMMPAGRNQWPPHIEAIELALEDKHTCKEKRRPQNEKAG